MQRTLNDGTTIDRLGFGLYKVDPDDVGRVVEDALAVGYRRVDGARFYGNEAELGRAIAASGIRDELTITSKFWGDPEQSRDACLRDFDATMTDLGLDRIDIHMIHWPRASRNRFVEVWRTLLELRDQGRIRTVAVANFDADELTRLIEETGVTPAINQVELHPHLQQAELRAFHDEHGIATEAWSPLGRGELLTDDTIVDIARSHGASPAQVVLAWHLAVGNLVVPKSLRWERLAENLAAAELQLDDEDLARIGALERGQHYGSTSSSRQ